MEFCRGQGLGVGLGNHPHCEPGPTPPLGQRGISGIDLTGDGEAKGGVSAQDYYNSVVAVLSDGLRSLRSCAITKSAALLLPTRLQILLKCEAMRPTWLSL